MNVCQFYWCKLNGKMLGQYGQVKATKDRKNWQGERLRVVLKKVSDDEGFRSSALYSSLVVDGLTCAHRHV